MSTIRKKFLLEFYGQLNDASSMTGACYVFVEECVPRSVSDADRKTITDLEETEARLRNENSKLKVFVQYLLVANG